MNLRDRLCYPHEDPGDKGKLFTFSGFIPKA